jgi:hypothetical protein
MTPQHLRILLAASESPASRRAAVRTCWIDASGKRKVSISSIRLNTRWISALVVGMLEIGEEGVGCVETPVMRERDAARLWRLRCCGRFR